MSVQYPIDGAPKKAWKVTSYMGWRIHPITKKRSHHNGTDIIATAKVAYIEAPIDALVVQAGFSDGLGYNVTLRHKINGAWYTSRYGHMAKGSLSVKAGQQVVAGTRLGVMGSTGLSTGRHLHWELQSGKNHTWNATGVGFIEPVHFFSTLIAQQAALEASKKAAVVPEVVAPEPSHDDAGAVVAEENRPKIPAPAKIVYKVRSGDSYWKIAKQFNTDWKRLKRLNNNRRLFAGNTIRIK